MEVSSCNLRQSFNDWRAERKQEIAIHETYESMMKAMHAMMIRYRAGRATGAETEEAVAMITEMIGYYEDELSSKNAIKHYGGYAFWMPTLVIIEFCLWLAGVSIAINKFGMAPSGTLYIAMLVIVAIPIDLLIPVWKKLFNLSLRHRINKLRLWRDQLLYA